MLKELFEQVIYSENVILISWAGSAYGMMYTYRFNDYMYLRIHIDSPFKYDEKNLLELIHKDIIHVIKLEIW